MSSETDIGGTGQNEINGTRLSHAGLGDVVPPVAAAGGAAVTRRRRLGGWVLAVLALIGIAGSILLSIWISAVTPSVAAAHPNLGLPTIPGHFPGPPWWPHSWNPRLIQLVLNSWYSLALGLAGLLAALGALALGFRPRPRLLLGAGVAIVVIFAFLPPAESADTLNYAAYGRLTVLGFNPYVTTLSQADHFTSDPVIRNSRNWVNNVSVYGPLATAEQYLAAELGGISAGRIVFWLKVWNALAFLAVALALDRLLRADPVRRARAHLLWTVNPLLLWVLVASGHVDGIATAFGFCGLLVLTSGPKGQISAQRALASGLLVGAAADFKINLALFILAAAWACRKSKASLLALAGGAAVMVVPAFAAFGTTAIGAMLSRGQASTWDTLYKLIYEPLGFPREHMTGLPIVAAIVFVLVAALALRYLPDGPPGLPAIRPALAMSLAWLLAWPFQRPWYDAIAFCLLAVYVASAVDWLMVARLALGVSALMTSAPPDVLRRNAGLAFPVLSRWPIVPPLGRLLALLLFCVICVSYASRRWTGTRPGLTTTITSSHG